MNINATMIGQSITFFFFVWFCMKFVWPPIMQALEARTKQIADGLAAAERGKHEQELAQKRASEVLHQECIGFEQSGGKGWVKFPYFQNSVVVNVKYRTATKDFRQEKGGKKILYRLDLADERLGSR